MIPLLALFAVHSRSPAALEAPKAVEDLLANMRKAYSSARTVNMQVQVKLAAQNGTASGRFSFKYQSPNKIRYTSDIGTGHVERYCDGKQVITIRNATRTSSPAINVDTLGGQVQGNLEWLSFFDWKRQLSTGPGSNMAQSTFKLIPKETWKGKSWTVLEETAKALNLQVRYFIDPKTFLIWRCDVTNISQKRLVVQTEVLKLELNPAIDPKVFVAPPP